MPLFSFLNKIRSRPTRPTRQSPFIPDRILDFDPLVAYVNEAVTNSNERAASMKKMRAFTPLNAVCEEFPKAKAPVVSRHPSGRQLLSSTLNPNVSTFVRRSTRRSTRKSSLFRRPFLRPRRLEVSNSIVDTDLSLVPSLLNYSTSDKLVTLHGTITAKVLDSLLTNVGKQKKLVFDEAFIQINPAGFSSLIASLEVESLFFLDCKFEDAQLICDRFFVENGQIAEMTVSTKDGSPQSFPLLTDRTLERWTSLRTQPPCLQLHNVSTSFTIAGVEKAIKSFLSTATSSDRFCCKFGHLNSSMDTIVARLNRIHSLKIHVVTESFLVVLALNPPLELTLQTPSRIPSTDVTHDDLPALRRVDVCRRRRFQPVIVGSSTQLTNPFVRNFRSSTIRVPESKMVTNSGIRFRTRKSMTRKSKSAKNTPSLVTFY